MPLCILEVANSVHEDGRVCDVRTIRVTVGER